MTFQASNPVIDGVDFTRPMPFNPSCPDLGAWSESVSYNGPTPVFSDSRLA